MPCDYKLFVCPYFSFSNRGWGKNIILSHIEDTRSEVYIPVFVSNQKILDILRFNFYMYIHMHTHRYVCLYTYIYIYLPDTYIYVYTYIYIHVCVCSQSCLTLCDPIDCSPLGSSVHEIFQAWNTGAGCHFCLQGIFPTQGLNLCLLHLQADSLPLCHLRSPCTYIHTHK